MPSEKKPRLADDTQKKKPFSPKRIILLIVTTLIVFVFYQFAEVTAVFGEVVAKIVFWVYLASALGFSLAYVIYNRGFTRENLTAADLPDTMSDDEKDAFFRERDGRKQKSRWMLIILFALAVTFFFDIFYLFFGDKIFPSGGKS